MCPRVLLVGNFLSSVLRTRSVCEDLAARLLESGWDVRVTSRVKARVPRALDMMQTAWRHRDSYDVAQVDVFSGAAFLWAEGVCAVLRAAHKPYVLTLHGGNLPTFAARWPRRVERLLRSAAAVTTPSRFLLERLHSLRGGIRLLPNALDLSTYQFRVRARPAPQLVWLRSFHRLYNPSLAPAVVARLVPRHPGVHLTMIGPDKGDGSLEETREQARRLGVEDRLTIRGGVPKHEVPRYLDRADIFINTTSVDNTPVSVLEAMASGLCVVSTAVGGIPYLLDHDCDALLVPADGADEMAAAVHRILTEPGLAAALARQARCKVEGFDWPVVLAQWHDVLSAAAIPPGSPS
jgi:glycosyltransferase involved in cell wall biosynthesis